MAEYKMIPVDQDTYDKLKLLCEKNQRKQGAQVRELVNIEWEKLNLLKIVAVEEAAVRSEKPARMKNLLKS